MEMEQLEMDEVETMDDNECLSLEAEDDTNIVSTFLNNFNKNF